jgi:hypothetical protein
MIVEPYWVQVSEPALRQGDLLPSCLVPISGLDSATENGPREGMAIDDQLADGTRNGAVHRRLSPRAL